MVRLDIVSKSSLHAVVNFDAIEERTFKILTLGDHYSKKYVQARVFWPASNTLQKSNTFEVLRTSLFDLKHQVEAQRINQVVQFLIVFQLSSIQFAFYSFIDASESMVNPRIYR